MTLSASHAAFSDPNRGEAKLDAKAFEAARRGYERGMEVSHVDCLEAAIRAYLAASVGESTIWIVKVWNADGTDSDEYVFNTKADYDLFLKEKPAQLDISDIHERTVTNAAEALEHASELAATPTLPSEAMESGK